MSNLNTGDNFLSKAKMYIGNVQVNPYMGNVSLNNVINNPYIEGTESLQITNGSETNTAVNISDFEKIGTDHKFAFISANAGLLYGATISTTSWVNNTILNKLSEISGLEVDTIKSINSGVQYGNAGNTMDVEYQGLAPYVVYTIGAAFVNTQSGNFGFNKGTFLGGYKGALTTDGDYSELTGGTDSVPVGAVAAIFTIRSDSTGTIGFKMSRKSTLAFLTIKRTNTIITL